MSGSSIGEDQQAARPADLSRLEDCLVLPLLGRRHQNGRSGIDGGLLDPRVSNPRTQRFSSLAGECQAREKCFRQKNRCAGLPVDSTAAQFWVAAGVFSTGGPDVCLAQLSAIPGRIGLRPQYAMPAHAESLTANERSTAPGFERHHRRQWPADHRGHSGWGAGCQQTGGPGRSPGQGHSEALSNCTPSMSRKSSSVMSRRWPKWPNYPPGLIPKKSRCPPRNPGRKANQDLMAGKDLREELYRWTGVDLSAIEGVGVLTAQVDLSEIGTDMSCWRTEKHFSSWLGLCPDNRISGGKVLSRHTRRVINPVADALRIAATTLERSKTALGAFYHRTKV